FDRVGVFCYSHEESTASFEMTEQVPERIKTYRRNALMAAARDITLASNRQMVGQHMDVLIEGRPEAGSAYFAGRSYRDAPEVDGLILVRAEGPRANGLQVGEMVRTRVDRALAYDLLARVV